MTFTPVGFDNADITEGGFARLMQRVGEVANKHGVTSGFVVTPGSGTRGLSISPGASLFPGLLADSDAVEAVSVGANGGTANRTDMIVLQADWAANTVTSAVVAGSSPTPPTLTQDAGSLWQLPLARITVRPGVTSIASGDITVCKPVPRRIRILRANVSAGSATSGTATLSTITVDDPGWPYLIETVGQVRMQTNSSAKALLQVVDAAGGVIGSAISPDLDSAQQLVVADSTLPGSPYSGATTARLRLSRSSGTGSVDSNAGSSTFYVKQIPA